MDNEKPENNVINANNRVELHDLEHAPRGNADGFSVNLYEVSGTKRKVVEMTIFSISGLIGNVGEFQPQVTKPRVEFVARTDLDTLKYLYAHLGSLLKEHNVI